jgi:hypothetical protein
MTYWKLERPSKRSGKKWQVRVPTSSGRGKTVPFGDASMQDYTIHKDKARRDNYRTRHQHDRIDDPYAPGFWSWWSLWGESSDLKKAHAAAVKRAKKILGVKKDEEGNEVATKAPKASRKNPNPPGTPTPTMAEVAEVVAVLDVPKHLRAEFMQGFATEWEHAHTVGYDLVMVGSIVLDHLAEDAHYYRKLRRLAGHDRKNPHADETSPSDRVQSCFDALLSLVQEQYPSLSCTIEVDEAAGERGGHACNRAYAFCEDLDDGSFRIAVAHKLNDADDSRVEGLLRHELAHAVLLHTGDLEHTERDADEVAEALFGSPLFYDEEDVQTTDQSAPGARRPRPPYLDDEQGRTRDAPTLDEARPNPYSAGTMHQLETVEDVASCLDDCAAQGDAKTPRMLASQFSQQSKDVAGAQARMLTTLAKAARHCANGIEARLAGEVDRAMASERLCERALADAQSPSRMNPEWAKKLGSGLYKGARYGAETARDLYRGAREAHAAHSAPPVEGERKNPESQFQELIALRDSLEKQRKQIAEQLDAYPINSMGLTPDEYKDDRWRELKRESDKLFKKLQDTNSFLVKNYKKELAATRRRNPRRRASYGDEYKYFIVDASGEPESGWEYREDAKDALREGSSGRPGLKIAARSRVDADKLAAFFERNRDNPSYFEHGAPMSFVPMKVASGRLPGIGRLTITTDPEGARDRASVEVTKAFADEWDHGGSRTQLMNDVIDAAERHRGDSNFYAIALKHKGREFFKAYPHGAGV